MSDRALQKAFLADKETGERLAFRFNPREYTLTKSSTWQKTPAKGAASAPKQEFLGANPCTLQMELFFDAWETRSANVGRDVETLLGWTRPTQKSIAANSPNPPIVVFHWGATSFFDAYVKQVGAKYTLFDPDGTPLRATVSVTLEEVPNEPARQNPTSGGPPGRRMHVLAEGETLHSLAYREYGDPTLWRGVAAANGIDDPLRVGVGTRLIVPNRTHAEDLA